MKNAIIDFETNAAFGYGYANIRKGMRNMYISLYNTGTFAYSGDYSDRKTIKIILCAPTGQALEIKGKILKQEKHYMYVRLNKKLNWRKKR